MDNDCQWADCVGSRIAHIAPHDAHIEVAQRFEVYLHLSAIISFTNIYTTSPQFVAEISCCKLRRSRLFDFGGESNPRESVVGGRDYFVEQVVE
jgi:hypothetical protein